MSTSFSARQQPLSGTLSRRRLLQLVEAWWDQQLQKLRAWIARGLTALLTFVLLAVFAAALLVAAAVRLLDGLSHALSAAWGGPEWTGDLAVGLAVLGQRFSGGDIARANAAFTIVYTLGGLVGRPIAGGAMDAFGRSGLSLTLARLVSDQHARVVVAQRR